jgi:PAS domain S-box-containing protein
MIEKKLTIFHLSVIPDEQEVIGEELKQAGFTSKIFRASSEMEFVRILDNQLPDVIITGWQLPQFSASEALAILKWRKLSIPVILLVAPELERYAVNELKQGFNDCLTYDRLMRLPFAILNAMEKVNLEKERYGRFSGGLTTASLLAKTEKMAKIGTVEIDILTKRRTWSAGVEAIFGFNDGTVEHSFETFIKRVHPDDMERVMHEVTRAIQGHGDIDMEYCIITPDGILKYLHSQLVFECDEAGTYGRLAGFIRDITENKQTELELKKANKELNSLFQTIDEVFFTRDMVESRLIQISPACEKMYGYTQAEFFAEPGLWHNIMHPEDVHLQQEHHAMFEAGKTVVSQYRVVHKTNGIRWAESKIIPGLDENGKLVRLDGVTRDITERKHAERMVEETQDIVQQWLLKRNTILNALPLQIALLDEEGYIVDVNEAWKKFGNQNGLVIAEYGIGTNYIAIAENAEGDGEATGKAVAAGIRQVISGQKAQFVIEYPCHSGLEKGWYQLIVSPLSEIDNRGAVVLHHNITERKTAEIKLAESERQYRNMIETAQEGIWVIDDNLVTIFVNKKMCEMLGYTYDEIIGKHNYDFKQEFEKLATLKRIAARERGSVETHESIFLTKDGRKIICIVATNSIFGPDGEFIGSLAMVTDITDRKRQENALKQSEANLSAIIENTTDMVYSLDNELRFITYNQRFKSTMEHVYGFKVNKAINASVLLSKVPPKTAKKWQGVYKKALAGQTLNFVAEYPYGNGKVYLNYSVNPIWKSGEVIGLSVFTRDITQQKQNEVNLIRSEANLRSVFETTHLYTVLFNADLQIVSFNKNAGINSVKYFGKKLKVSKSGFDYFPKSRWPVIRQVIERVKNKEVVSYEVIYDLADGSKEWFEAKWAGVFNAKKEAVGIILTLNFITDKKLAELDRERITADLLRRNQDLEQFTYIISHNLRVPVANIIGLSHLLGFQESDDAEFSKTLAALSNSVSQLDSVITDLNQILEINKQLNVKKEVILFSDLVEEIGVELQTLLEKSEAILNCDFDDADQIYSIKPYLYSVFQNLIVNSVKYRRDDLSPVVNIRTVINDNRIYITFEDNGRGIDTDRVGGQLFGLYKRFDYSVEGNGMGLFMVKKQVESLGGTIAVESQIDHGTKFLITLPVQADSYNLTRQEAAFRGTDF